MEIKLFNGNHVLTIEGNTIISNLKIVEGDNTFLDETDDLYNKAIDMLESIVLAHHLEGIDVNSDKYKLGLEIAIEGLANSL